jgi:hypothetical protein
VLVLGLAILPPAALADGNQWASRPGSYLVRNSDSYEEYSGRTTVRNSSLQAYWENQRAAQRETARSQGHAWYGLYGPYYVSTAQPSGSYGPREYFAPFSPYRPCAPSFPCHGLDCESSLFDCHDGLCDSGLFLDSLVGMCH